MSRSSKSNLIVRDNRVELLLRFTQSGNVVKNNFRFLVLLRALRMRTLIVSMTARVESLS